MELSSTSTVSAMSTDAQFLVQLIPYVMGQHVTLDVQLPPPWMSRLPGSEPPLLELVQFHLQRYQQQWPIEINSRRPTFRSASCLHTCCRNNAQFLRR